MAWPVVDRVREEIKQHLQWPRLPRQLSFYPNPSLQWLLTRGTGVFLMPLAQEPPVRLISCLPLN